MTGNRGIILLAILFAPACGCATMRPVRVLHGGPAYEAVFSADRKVLAATTADGKVRLWNVSTGEQLAQCDGYALAYGSFCTRRLALSPDGARVAFAARDRSVRIWDWRDGRVVAELAGHPHPLSYLQFIADDRLVSASGGFSYDRAPRTTMPKPTTRRGFEPPPVAAREPLTVITWDVSRGGGGEELSRWQDDAAGVLYAVVAADGRSVSTIGVPGMPRRFADISPTANYRREIAVWDASSGTVVQRWADTGEYMPVHLAPSHDGRLLLSSGPAGMSSAPGVLRDVAKGTTRPVMIRGADFSPDDRRLRVVADVSKPVFAFPVFSLFSPPPKPKVRAVQVEVPSGKVIMSRDVRTDPRTWPIGWTNDFTMFVDRELRLWKVPAPR